MLTRSTVDLYRPRLALTVKRGLRLAVVAALALGAPATALADTDPLETVVPAAAPAAAPGKGAKAPGAKVDPKAAKGEGAKGEAKPVSAEEKAARGVVVIERAGQALALGAVLSGDGRILSSLSPLGSGNDLDVRFADGTSARVKLGHHDRAWDLALLVPQSGRWPEGSSPPGASRCGPTATSTPSR